MEKEFTEVYCGGGKGKTTLAIGQCLRASAQGKSVIIIQFLKGRERRELDFLEELDNLDIKIFRFEKHDEGYEELNEQEKAQSAELDALRKQSAERSSSAHRPSRHFGRPSRRSAGRSARCTRSNSTEQPPRAV